MHSLFSWVGMAGQLGRFRGGFAFLKGTPILLKISFTIMIKIKYILPINHCNFIK